MGKSINNQGHKVIFVDLMKEDEFSDGIYRESGILDLKTSFGCEFKMYMERKYQSV